jgi:hypothetical protein
MGVIIHMHHAHLFYTISPVVVSGLLGVRFSRPLVELPLGTKVDTYHGRIILVEEALFVALLNC